MIPPAWMAICPVCDQLLTDQSASPDYCGEDCQAVWHAGLAWPLGAEIRFALSAE